MPEEKKGGFTDLAAENQKVHDKLLAQGTPNLTPEFNADTGSALDQLLVRQKKLLEEPGKTESEPETVPPKPKEEKETPKVDPKESNEPEPEEKSEESSQEVEPEEKHPDAEIEDSTSVEKAKVDETPSPEDPFKDSPQLPEGASRKSHEAFAYVKTQAAAKYQDYEKRISELEQKLSDAETKLADPVPVETKQELESLRKFRAKLDIDADPQFKQWNKDIAQAEEFIYAQLRKSPNIDEATIEKIKGYGGPAAVKMDQILDTVDDKTIRRIVEAKMTDIELHKFNREQALRSAKENVDAYLKEREKAWEESAVAHNRSTEQHLSEFLGGLKWTHELAPKQGASEEDKKAIVQHNQFVRQVKGDLKAALDDDSPKMRATLLTGMAQLFYLQDAHKKTLSRNEVLEKENVELKEKLSRFKKASVGRLKDSSAPAPGSKPLPRKSDDIFDRDTGSALDSIRDQIASERARANL